MPIGSQEKIVLLCAHVHDLVRLAHAVGAKEGVFSVTTEEQARIDLTCAQVLLLTSEDVRRHLPLSVHSWMALQMILSTQVRPVYLALPTSMFDTASVVLYRMSIVQTSHPSFLLVRETLGDHTIDLLDAELGLD